jgi:uncharacterized protein (DUF1499 family)
VNDRARTAAPVSRIVILALALAALAALAAMAAGFGAKWRLWDFRTGFAVLEWAAWGGLAAAGVALVGAVLARLGAGRRGFLLALCALAVGLATFAVPWQQRNAARALPRIHDITTDTDNPPVFRAVLPLRRGAQNPPEYGGAEIPAQQKKGYPDIAPLRVSRPRADAYEAALVAAAEMGWTIVAKAPAEGRIEATDTTFWFGFTDDIVIRVAPDEQAERTRIDIRSKSRIGRSDVGTNAARVRAYLERLRDRLRGRQ